MITLSDLNEIGGTVLIHDIIRKSPFSCLCKGVVLYRDKAYNATIRTYVRGGARITALENEEDEKYLTSCYLSEIKNREHGLHKKILLRNLVCILILLSSAYAAVSVVRTCYRMILLYQQQVAIPGFLFAFLFIYILGLFFLKFMYGLAQLL